MAPSQKRSIEDDFIHTLSDNDDQIAENEEVAVQPPKKKAKTNKKSAKKSKDEEPQPEENEGVWGQKDENDGAMDSDFEFMVDDAGDLGEDEFEGWGFEGAKKGMAVEKAGVDLDEIIRRRREKKNQKAGKEEDISPDDEAEIDMDDDEDGVLADDAFGMNVDSDAEESGEDADANSDKEDDGDKDEDEDDDAASDNDSVATPVGHPDDMSDDDDEEDAEEKAKRDAFFAPEEKPKPGQKVDVSSFQAMSLSRPILRGITTVGFSKPTPIQAKTIPIALMGKDLVGGAVTGSGKTAAFVLPILERLLYRPKKIPTTRVVILTPTRELAIQCHAVATKLAAHTDIKFTLAVGGLSLKAQEVELRLRPDVIIATPGRFIDHMRNSASFSVDTVEILVLDEADRMLEDGFADELNEILTTLPKSRQTMLFSATMTSTVDRLIKVGLNKPVRVMVDSQKKTAGTLTQEFVRLRPGREEKRMGYLRIASVESFRDGKVCYLLATDLASRGLDIKGVDTVINYEAPQSVEIYVHRVGRTARAGRHGTSVTLAAEPDRKVVKAAVKAGKAQGSKIISRVIEVKDADKWQAEIDEMDDEIAEIEKEEKEERQLAQVEMQIKKGENIIEHEAEIKSRPKRTWFETQQDKKNAKQAGRDELNGPRAAKKKGGNVKLSNKDKKKLDAKAERVDKSMGWKKDRYRERLFDFHLDTLPKLKYRIQSRIYRYILGRQSKRRALSGIPVPRADQNQGAVPLNPNDELREQEKIAQEAAMIERRGREEKRIANSGAYSEQPREDTSFGGPAYPLPRPLPARGDSRTPDSLSGSPKLPTRQNSSVANELTEAELATANANLMARIAPFMTNPLVALPITIFFYNESKSQSRNVLTDDAGHFAIRAPLDFVPTHVKILVNEGLSTTQEVKYIEPYGVSLISDIDDTVKMSNISAGAREIFRNTFVRELADLTIEGTKEWYGKMQDLGVSVHYCSNSPWQLFPMLATFFKVSGLPLGSLHLKQYSGMLQGIFEPVAERKKNTLVRLLRDFPQRKFLLVGDSGEADLEVYTELALAYPERILAVFIRDVTTPETAGYFDSSFEMTRRTMSGLTLNSNSGPANNRPATRQNSAPGSVSDSKPPTGPVMGTLIDFSDEPEEAKIDDVAVLEQIKRSRPGPSASVSATDLLARKPPPPPRPAKPAALASTPAIPTARKGSVGLGISGAATNNSSEPPPPPPRKPVGQSGNQPVHPLAQIQNSSQQTIESTKTADKPPPPPPRRSTKNLSPRMVAYFRGPSSNSDVDFDPLPPSLAPVPAATGLSFYRPNSRSGNTSPSGSPTMGAVNKKLELWRRRLARAHDQLDHLGVALYTWRKGQDVEAEAVGIIKRYMEELEKEKRMRRS
ncbi:uncharacterized protein TRIVIDRAFT_196232 [Trichoderma virens Gv29-8]|uniref:Uncharacterized protein n=1 Tax=Hypocrea virens (strain Gv29-8 / FGSC 10586) TaxID=413071 RepID=G9NCE7_HYPVG|nr:uncharacterized protein TRIVIDRAFT_196232 [Trichoderma virens Gv29-8]EHK15371.1 hypothetical protein TRIVIDRAFT_196232 [Trichoderma virens Gv29-8]